MLADFILETCTAPGNGSTVNLAGAPPGRRTFAQAFASGVNVFYFLDDGTQAEWGWGTFTTGSPNTLSRTNVDGNTAGSQARLNFAGTTRVYNMVPAARMLWIDETGDVATTANMKANTYECRAGNLGSYSGNGFNINWDGVGATLWIDSTDLGYISTASDGRYKHTIAPVAAGALARILTLVPVTYRWQSIAPFQDDGTTFEGFIAQDVLPVIPTAVKGLPTDENPMSLQPLALIAELVKAMQEMAADFAAYKAAHP